MTTPPNAPPPAGGYGAPGPSVNNFLVPAILTVFCCWPLAIPAIINAAKVNTLVSQGDYAGAQAAAASAKKFALWALIAGIVLGVLYILLVVIVGVGSNAST